MVLWDLKSKKADYRYTYDEVGASFLLLLCLQDLLWRQKLESEAQIVIKDFDKKKYLS